MTALAATLLLCDGLSAGARGPGCVQQWFAEGDEAEVRGKASLDGWREVADFDFCPVCRNDPGFEP